MAKRSKLKYFLNAKSVKFFTKKIRFSTLEGISLHQLLKILIKGISNRTFGLRVGAVAWAFFFSLFPFLIFLFNALPYAPLYAELIVMTIKNHPKTRLPSPPAVLEM